MGDRWYKPLLNEIFPNTTIEADFVQEKKGYMPFPLEEMLAWYQAREH